jgi:hypothetical protein
MLKRFLAYAFVITIFFTSCVTDPAGLSLMPMPVWEPFDGSLASYRYMHQGRDREWEEDAVIFAFELLIWHPLLSNNAVANKGRYEHRIGRHIYMLNLHDDPVFYKPAYLRNEFLRRINELIPAIPSLEDYEIIYQLLEIVALLGDAHTTIGNYNAAHFTGCLSYFYDGFYGIWQDSGVIKTGRLIAVNYEACIQP